VIDAGASKDATLVANLISGANKLSECLALNQFSNYMVIILMVQSANSKPAFLFGGASRKTLRTKR